MRSFKGEFLNYLEDGVSLDIFDDLSDMANFHRLFNTLIQRDSLKYSCYCQEEAVMFLCTSNPYKQFYKSLVFFKISNGVSVSAVAAFTKNRLENNTDFIFSVGYFVAEKLRGRGAAKNLLKIALPAVKEFFSKFGPHVELGPDGSYNYKLESVIAKDNLPSNALAKRMLHSGGEIAVGDEYRTNTLSNVYTLLL